MSFLFGTVRIGAIAALAIASFGCSRASLLSGAPSGQGETNVPPELPCVLFSAGAPKTFVSFPEGNTDAPVMVTLDPGSQAAPARIAYQAISEDANFWHPELRVGAFTAGDAWPGDVSFDHEPTLYGFDAHAWGAITASPEAPERIGLAWYHSDEASGQPTGLKFKPIDTTDWISQKEVFVDPIGTVVYSFSRGPGVGASGDFGGIGYAIAYRGETTFEDVEPRVVLIDVQGNVLYGPVAAAAPEPYPGRGNGVVWSGSHYLVATGMNECLSDLPCAPRSVVLSRLAPPSEGSGLLLVNSIPALPSLVPRRPALAARGERVFVAWAENAAVEDDGLRTVRLARFDAAGALLGDVETLAEGARILSPLAINASPIGVFVAWVEQGEDDGPPDQPGFTRVVIHQRDMAGAMISDPTVIQATQAANNPGPALAVTERPKALWVSWAGIESEAGPDKTFLARFECGEGP